MLALPSIWTSNDPENNKSYVELFGKLLSHGSLTSNPTYWQKIQVLFQVLRDNKEISSSQQLDWITNGLLPGASKEMRQSAGIAHQVAYTILVDVITGIKEDETRKEAWDARFIPLLHDYLLPTASKPNLDAYIDHVFSEIMVHLSRTSPEFNEIWREGCNFELEMMHASQGGQGRDFKRWINLTLSIIHKLVKANGKGMNTQVLDGMVETFLGTTAWLFSRCLECIVQSKLDWYDGMMFIATMLEDPLFCECLVNVDSMSQGLNDFENIVVQPDVIPQLLRSRSSQPFLRVIVVFCRLFKDEGLKTWDLVVETATSKEQLSDFQKPNSLISQLVSTLKPSFTYLKAPPGANEAFAQQIATALDLNQRPESDEAKGLIDLLVSIVSLRGKVRA